MSDAASSFQGLDQPKTAIPTLNTMFSRAYVEVDKLRNCGMNRRDVMLFIDMKEYKSSAAKSVAFWEGVMSALKLGNQVESFKHLPYYQDFLFFAEKSLHTEIRIYEKACTDQLNMKQNYIEFCT